MCNSLISVHQTSGCGTTGRNDYMTHLHSSAHHPNQDTTLKNTININETKINVQYLSCNYIYINREQTNTQYPVMLQQCNNETTV